MSNFWIGDAYGRVLGPLTLELLQDLILAGRVRGITQVSLDGNTWAPVEEFPAIAQFQAANSGEARRANDQREAARLGVELEKLQARAPHEVFGLAPDAPIQEWRACFFRLVKQFYPERIDPDASPELRRVTTEIFQYLSELMAFIERHPPMASSATAAAASAPPSAPSFEPTAAAAATAAKPTSPRRSGPHAVIIPPPPPDASTSPGTEPSFGSEPVAAAGSAAAAAIPRPPTPPRPFFPAATPTPVPRGATPGSAAAAVGSRTPVPSGPPTLQQRGAGTGGAPGAEIPSYRLNDFVGLERREDDIVEAHVRVSPATLWIFTADRLFSFSKGSAFIPCREAQPLGSRVEVRFFFADPAREVSTRGIVCSWNAGDGKQPRGFGIQFTRLYKDDAAFIREYIAKHT